MKLKNIFSSLALFSFLIFGNCPVTAREIPLYKDTAQPVERRVVDLLNRMTLEEKIAQLSHLHGHQLYNGQEVDMRKLAEAAGNISYGCVEGFNLTGNNARKAFHNIQRYMVENTRWGIPVLTVSESLHGSVHDGSTIFPQSVAVGSTFNTDLAYRMTKAIAAEVKSQGVIQTLSPGLDVVRDLRWGRVEESFGEDPYLVGRMGIAQVNGYIDGGVAPMLKPYGPGGAPLGGLNLASVESGERDVRNIHIKPYEMVVRNTPVKAVMTSYNSWNGIPNSASHFLLTEILRDEWGFTGYVYSDWGAVGMLKDFHHTAEHTEAAGIQALLAGVDVEAASKCYLSLIDAVQSGRLDEKEVDRAVERVLRVKFELGLFENPYQGSDMPGVILRTEEAVALSREVADEAIVLMKNENNLLPLNADNIRSLAVIGPNADQVQFGDYTWSRSNADGITPLEGIRQIVGDRVKIYYARGCDLVTDDTSGFAEAIAAAKTGDVSIVFTGSSSASLSRDYSNVTCGEGFDLSSIELTGVQEALIRAVHAAGKPVVLVLVTGKPFAIPWAAAHIPAIAVQWYGGERAGDAIAAMLFGRTNPSAKTPFSFPQSTGHLPVFYNHLPSDKGYYRRPGSPNHPGRDYVFASPEALWPFGHGLSYTTFEYTDVSLSSEQLQPSDTFEIKVSLKNTGKMAGKEVVQLYVRDVVSSVVTPVKQLKAFVKPILQPGETQTVLLKLPIRELAFYDRKMNKTVEEGEYELQIGSSSGDIRLRKNILVGSSSVTVTENFADANMDAGEISRNTGKQIMVTGVIRDVQATPVGGVTVKSGYSGKETVSSKNGEYTILSVENDVLTISGKNFETIRVKVNKRKNIDVKLNYKH
jgi:beta-glucosidase